MERETIFAEVCAVLREHLLIEQPLRYDTDIVQDLHLDSMAQMTLLFELEVRFRTAFDIDESTSVRTLDDVVVEIGRCLQQRPAAVHEGAVFP